MRRTVSEPDTVLATSSMPDDKNGPSIIHRFVPSFHPRKNRTCNNSQPQQQHLEPLPLERHNSNSNSNCIMTLLSDFARNVANAPSTTAANDRSTVVVTVEGVETIPIPIIPQWPQSVSSSTPMLMNPSILLACSPGSSPTGSVQSLQAKLLAARRKNELLEEIERGVDSDGYPLCQYRKTFLGHLKGKAIVMSVSRSRSSNIVATIDSSPEYWNIR